MTPFPPQFVPGRSVPVADHGPVNLALSTPDHLRSIGQPLDAAEILTHERPYIPGEPLEYRTWSHVPGDLQYTRHVPQPVVENPITGKPYQGKPVPQQEGVPPGQRGLPPTQPTFVPQYRASPPPPPEKPSQNRFPSPVRFQSPVRSAAMPVELSLSGPDGMNSIGQNVKADQHLFHERPYVPGNEYNAGQLPEGFPSTAPQVPLKPGRWTKDFT